MENKKAADKALEFWEFLKKIVAFWEKLSKSKQPQCKSFETLKLAVHDKFSEVKLEFLSFIASYLVMKVFGYTRRIILAALHIQ